MAEDNEKVEAERAARMAFDQAQHRLSSLTDIRARLREQLEEERRLGKPDVEELKTSSVTIQREIDQIQSTIDQAKAAAKQRKADIAELDERYMKLAEPGQEGERAALLKEREKLAAEVGGIENQIYHRELDKLEAQGRLEQVKIRLEAVLAGVYDLPIERDPRISGLEEEINRAAAAVQQARLALPENS